MKSRDQLLIEIIFDNSASITEKDDAAVALRDFPKKEVIEALVIVGSNQEENPVVLDSCGESLGEIWSDLGEFNQEAFSGLTRTAKFGVKHVLKNRKPDWIDKCII